MSDKHVWNGKTCNVRTWARPLSHAEIMAVYDQKPAGRLARFLAAGRRVLFGWLGSEEDAP